MRYIGRSDAIAMLAVALMLGGCESQFPFTLMPTPVIYQQGQINPFTHLPAQLRTTDQAVFYATNRGFHAEHNHLSNGEMPYGSSVDDQLHLGTARVRLGGTDADWSMLEHASLNRAKDDPKDALPLSVQQVQPMADIAVEGARMEQLPPGARQFFAEINHELALAHDKEIMLYVHGAKVGFANAVTLAAEIDHFAGRDFVGMAFSWPSHGNIVAYLFGIDVQRALDSSAALAQLLTLLADYTTAERINLISYSAGGRVASKALLELRETRSEMSPRMLQKRFRIGSVVFAAADVTVERFFERLPAISDIAEQVVITVTSDDSALAAARRYMGGDVRLGQEDAESVEREFIRSHELPNVEIIDVSIGREQRGFDIVGHHYWYRHPWMSSDIIFLMRTALPPERRGLSVEDETGIWYLSDRYPEAVRDAARVELKGQW